MRSTSPRNSLPPLLLTYLTVTDKRIIVRHPNTLFGFFPWGMSSPPRTRGVEQVDGMDARPWGGSCSARCPCCSRCMCRVLREAVDLWIDAVDERHHVRCLGRGGVGLLRHGKKVGIIIHGGSAMFALARRRQQGDVRGGGAGRQPAPARAEKSHPGGYTAERANALRRTGHREAAGLAWERLGMDVDVVERARDLRLAHQLTCVNPRSRGSSIAPSGCGLAAGRRDSLPGWELQVMVRGSRRYGEALAADLIRNATQQRQATPRPAAASPARPAPATSGLAAPARRSGRRGGGENRLPRSSAASWRLIRNGSPTVTGRVLDSGTRPIVTFCPQDPTTATRRGALQAERTRLLRDYAQMGGHGSARTPASPTA